MGGVVWAVVGSGNWLNTHLEQALPLTDSTTIWQFITSGHNIIASVGRANCYSFLFTGFTSTRKPWKYVRFPHSVEHNYKYTIIGLLEVLPLKMFVSITHQTMVN